MSKQARAVSPRWEAVRVEQEAAVAAAVVALVSEDPGTLTVASVADRAGISRQTFYKHFGTLELAVLVTHGRVLADLGGWIGEQVAADQSANALGQVLRVYEALFEFFVARPDLLRFTSFYDFSFRVDRMSEADREEHPLVPPSDDPGGMYTMLRAGQLDGSIDPSLPVETTHRALSTSLLGVIQRLQIQDDWTNGRDGAAREVYAAVLDVWRARLATK